MCSIKYLHAQVALIFLYDYASLCILVVCLIVTVMKFFFIVFTVVAFLSARFDIVLMYLSLLLNRSSNVSYNFA